MSLAKIHRLLNPESVAVIGASDTEGSVGLSLIKNVLTGYQGKVFPVNVKHDTIQGLKAYHSVGEITDEVDLAIIATPAVTVPSVVEECGKKGIHGIVIISAGFTEAGEEGHELARKITETAKKYNIRIIGPNCLGFINPHLSLNASFASKNASPGKIALVSQSGALCTAILDWALMNNIGFSYFVSIGSMIDVTFEDLIDYFSSDPNTEAIIFYMESMNDAAKFLKAATECTKKKPIFAIKVGRSSEGAKAAMSHTGSLAGNDSAFDAVFERVGIVRLSSMRELFNCTQLLGMDERIEGENIMIITNAGGPGVIATDFVMQEKGVMAKLSQQSIEKLSSILPPTWSHGNPCDILGDADPTRYEKSIDICIKDKGVDSAIVVLTPQAMTNPSEVAREIVENKRKYGKPIIGAWIGELEVENGRKIMKEGRLACFENPEEAIDSVEIINRYHKLRDELKTIDDKFEIKGFIPKYDMNKDIINNAVRQKRFVLTEDEAKIFISNYGINVAMNKIAKTAKEAGDVANQIGFPVVVKILSPDIIHKTDVGGVKLGMKNSEEVIKAFDEVIKNAKKYKPNAKIEGVLVERMVNKGFEAIIGSMKDPIFGPLIVFGSGGISVELYKDTSIGLPPLNDALADMMMRKTKMYQLLKGYRGITGGDLDGVRKTLRKFGQMLIDFPEIKEVDINPVSINEKEIIALDAKIVLDQNAIEKSAAKYSHVPFMNLLN